jgi:hypothetical protein
MSLLDEEEEAQRVLIIEAMTASDISCWNAWQRYSEYTGVVNLFGIRAYLAGMVSLPIEECDLLAHAVNELIDERPPPPKASYRGVIPRRTNSISTGDRDKALDDHLAQWFANTSPDEAHRWRKP